MYDYYNDSRTESPFRVHPATMAMIVLNIAIFIIFNIFLEERGYDVVSLGTVSLSDIREKNEFYRLLTSMFLHADTEHLMNNMLVLFMIGGLYEESEGNKRFLFSYLLGGILAGLTSVGYDLALGTDISSLGASGAIFAIQGASIAAVIKDGNKLRRVSPIQLIAFAGLGIYSGLRDAHTDNAAHIGGFIAGFLIGLVISKDSNDHHRYR